MFKALHLTQSEDRKTHAAIAQLSEGELPEGDVRVRVTHSTINYKDALAITGKSPVVRKYPMVPGIDFAGTVLESSHGSYQKGDSVLLNGWGVGETHWGGLSEQARVQADWLLPMPTGMTAATAMSLGTAGYTAMLCVEALERHGVTPKDGPVLVTGANGGVGSVATLLFARRGYEVHASTGRPEEAAHLEALGASRIVARSDLNAAGKPLQKEQWAAAVDSVGSHTLANACAGLKYGGMVAACGLAQGMDLPASVAPFILRGITLYGIDSVYAPRAKRKRAWAALAKEVPADLLAANTRTVALSDVPTLASELLAGRVRGRLLVDLAQ